MTYNELELEFSNWVHFEGEPNELLVTVAVVLANRLNSIPVWLFLVGPASCMKSTILDSLDASSEIVKATELKEHALVSGYRDKTGKDYSLIAKLNNKTLVMGDMSTFLSMKTEQRASMFSGFRTAYDGRIASHGGTSGESTYSAKFGFLGGTTSTIESMRNIENSFGERFIYYNVNWSENDDLAHMIIANIGQRSEMNGALSLAMKSFLDEVSVTSNITISLEATNFIIRNVKKAVILRTSVLRDNRGNLTAPVDRTELFPRLLQQITILYHVMNGLVGDHRALNVVRKLISFALPALKRRVIAAIASGLHDKESIENRARIDKHLYGQAIQELKYVGAVDNNLNLNDSFLLFYREMTDVG